MSVPSAFLVVGHRHWGKSRTLRALSKKPGWAKIRGQEFFVRLMSNDDKPKDYERFIANLDPLKKPYVLIAYCPEEGSPRLLRALLRKYRIYPWILEHSYHGSRTVSGNEVAVLQRFGTVEVFGAMKRPATERALAFATFISRHT